MTDDDGAQTLSDPIAITAQSPGGTLTYSQQVLADSPRAYWRLGEASGTSAADSSGNNRTGTYLNTPTLSQTGALAGDANTAVAFNGTDEYVNVPYNAALNPAAFTVEAWANVTGGQGSFRSLVTSRDYAPGNARGFVLYAAPDNTWQFWIGSGDWNIVYGPAVQLNTWTHLAATYDGTTARMYVNGSSPPRRPWAPGRRAAPPADRHRQERGRSPVLPARTPGRGGRVRQRAVGGAGSGALRGGDLDRPATSLPSPWRPARRRVEQIPLNVNFNGSGSSDPDGHHHRLRLGSRPHRAYDDSTAQSPSFQYTTAGAYTVRLRVTDDDARDDLRPDRDHRDESGGTSYSARSSPTPRVPTGAWARRAIRPPPTPRATTAPARTWRHPRSAWQAPSRGILQRRRLRRLRPSTRASHTSRRSNPAQVHGRGLGVRHGRTGHLPLDRHLAATTPPATLAGTSSTLAPTTAGNFRLGNGGWNLVLNRPGGDQLNQWTHLVGTFDGTTARMYVNGTLAGSTAAGLVQNTMRPLRIASGATDKTAPQYYLPGLFDEVAVYASALSLARVQAHYAASD